MTRLLLRAAATASFAVLALLPVDHAFAQRRVALVIGNATYQTVAKLPNTINDANAIAELFRKAGFDVVVARQDLGVVEFKRALREFMPVARGAETAVMYFAGHGIEVSGTNYLIPVDAKLATDYDAEDEAVSLDRIVLALEPAQRLRLVILDACRDNPFNRKMQRTVAVRAVTTGLGKIEPMTTDTLVAYAAKAGSVSYDGFGSNSPFTTALLKYIAEPGLDIRIALGRVRDEVLKITGRQQEPFVYGSLGGTTVALVPAPENKKAEPPAASTNPDEVRRAYELAAQVGTREAWESFINTYRSGFYSELARLQLAKLKAAPAPEPAAEQEAKARAERERAERLALQQRQEEERRAKAEAERQKAQQDREQQDRLALQQRQEEERRAKEAERQKAQQERERQERLALQQRQEEERRAKADAERQKAQQERERQERLALQQRQEEERRAKEAERQKAQREAALRAQERVEPSPEQACASEERQLVRLRASASREEVVRFARELKCDALRPQVNRLLESLGAPSAAIAPVPAATPPKEPAPQPAPAPSERPESKAGAEPESRGQACSRDEERLAELRADPTREAVARFARELACEDLRPQVQRLLESLGGEPAAAAPVLARPAPREQAPQPAPAAGERREGKAEPETRAQACSRDEERLAQLRANPAREAVARFARELTCEDLRPQVQRLLESVGG